MFRVVKDRIQNQAYDVNHINLIYMFYGSVTEGLPPNFKIMLPAWVAGKPFDSGIQDHQIHQQIGRAHV